MSERLNHGRVILNLAVLFREFMSGQNGEVFINNVIYVLGEGCEVVPDVSIICDSTAMRDDKIVGPPDLAVEVSSSRKSPCMMYLYEKGGVAEYWIVDPESLRAERYNLKDGRFERTATAALYPNYQSVMASSVMEGLTVDLLDVFRHVNHPYLLKS